jgi:beta-lactamase class A
MSVYKMTEEGKLNLSSTYTLEELDLNDTFGDLYKGGADKTFTIEELVKIMLEKSDNTAANAIYKILNRIGVESPLDDVYNFMGWEFNEFGKKPDYEKIHLKILSNMFLTLYNAEYVSVEHSNKILKYLTNTPFDDKIVAGLPEYVPVSHKIGVATNNETFSDCGIVYAPSRNYLLCLGSNGGDEEKANKFMAEISEATYDYVINN